MNRVLKFRAWDKKLCGFKYFDFSNCLEIYNNSSEFEIQQFTGLKDKSGKEVYEGDLIEVDGWTKYLKKADIKFKYGCFTLNSLPMTQYSQTELIIVGNIFQNPEILT